MHEPQKVLFVVHGEPGSISPTLKAFDCYEDTELGSDLSWKGIMKKREWCLSQLKLAMEQNVSPLAIYGNFNSNNTPKDYYDLAQQSGYSAIAITMQSPRVEETQLPPQQYPLRELSQDLYNLGLPDAVIFGLDAFMLHDLHKSNYIKRIAVTAEFYLVDHLWVSQENTEILLADIANDVQFEYSYFYSDQYEQDRCIARTKNGTWNERILPQKAEKPGVGTYDEIRSTLSLEDPSTIWIVGASEHDQHYANNCKSYEDDPLVRTSYIPIELFDSVCSLLLK